MSRVGSRKPRRPRASRRGGQIRFFGIRALRVAPGELPSRGHNILETIEHVPIHSRDSIIAELGRAA
jgi:hypothetical protein